MKKIIVLLALSLSCLAEPVVYNWDARPSRFDTYDVSGKRLNGEYIKINSTLKSDESVIEVGFNDMHIGAIEYVVVSIRDKEIIRMDLDNKHIYEDHSNMTFRADERVVVETLAKAIMAETVDTSNTLMKMEFYDWNDKIVRMIEMPLDKLPQYSRGANQTSIYVTKGEGGIK